MKTRSEQSPPPYDIGDLNIKGIFVWQVFAQRRNVSFDDDCFLGSVKSLKASRASSIRFWLCRVVFFIIRHAPPIFTIGVTCFNFLKIAGVSWILWLVFWRIQFFCLESFEAIWRVMDKEFCVNFFHYGAWDCRSVPRSVSVRAVLGVEGVEVKAGKFTLHHSLCWFLHSVVPVCCLWHIESLPVSLHCSLIWEKRSPITNKLVYFLQSLAVRKKFALESTVSPSLFWRH